MPNVILRFTGVNAYVFGRDGLTVVAPNATRLGKSPQSKRLLPAHMLTIWRMGQVPQHFLWKSVAINMYDKQGKEIDSGVDRSNFQAVLDRSKLLRIPKSFVAGKIDPNRVSGRVHLKAGFTKDEKGPCNSLAWTGAPEPASIDALVNRMVVSIEKVAKLEIVSTNLLRSSAAVERAEIAVPRAGLTLFVGNVCSDDVLMRPCNDRTSVEDHDFEWMYALFDPAMVTGAVAPVVPKVGRSACGFKDTHSYARIQDTADTQFRGGGGGGLCGCQCIGCVAQTEDP